MKKLIYLFLFLALAGCKKETNPAQPKVIPASGGQDVMPTDGTDVVRVDPKAVQFTSVERRGGNGNGNGNGNNQTTDTTAWVINEHVEDWDVTWDTSVCGFLIMRWDAVKPATTTLSDDVYITDYGIGVEPISPTCAGVAVCLTNLFWTKYNSSCAIKANSTYKIRAAWSRYDNINKVCDKYFSEWVTVTTGIEYQYCQ